MGRCVAVGDVDPQQPCYRCVGGADSPTLVPAVDLPCTVDACVTGARCLADGRCVGTPVDADMDGETPRMCGGPDCDDTLASVSSMATDTYEGAGIQLARVVRHSGGTADPGLDAASDARGVLHAAWVDRTHNQVLYATYASKRWWFGVLPETSAVPESGVRVVVDADNNVLVLFGVGGTLHVHRLVQGVWSAQRTVGAPGDFQQVAGALDSSGAVHVVSRNNGGALVDQTWTPAGLGMPTLVHAGPGDALSLRRGLDGNLHAAFAVTSIQRVFHAQLGLTGWTTTPVMDAPGAGPTAVDADETGHVAVVLRNGAALTLASRRPGQGFVTGTLADGAAGASTRWDVGFQVGGRARVCADVAVAGNPGTSSMAQLLLVNTNGDLTNRDDWERVEALQFHASGCRVVRVGSGLTVLRGFGGLALVFATEFDGVLATQLLDGSFNRGRWIRAAMAADGTAHAVYRGAATQWIHHLTRVPGQQRWTPTPVPALPNSDGVDQHLALVLDPAGLPWVFARDVAARELVFMRLTASGWSAPALVDGDDDAGWRVAAALQPNGTPGLVFSDAANRLKVARWDGATSTFAVTTIQHSAGVDRRHALALTISAQGRWTVAWRGSGGRLQVVRGAPGAWEVPQTVDSTNNSGHAAMALDNQGNPHLVHQDSGPNDLRYCTSPNAGAVGSWTCQTVATAGDSGAYASISMRGGTTPVVAFVEDSTLRVMQRDAVGFSPVATVARAGDHMALLTPGTSDFDLLFHDPDNQDVRILSTGFRAATTTTLEHGDGVGGRQWGASAAANQALAVYQTRDNSALWLAKATQGTVMHTLLDRTRAAGAFSSVVGTADGRVHVAYTRESPRVVVLGVLQDEQFTPTEIPDSVGLGEGLALALSPTGDAHVLAGSLGGPQLVLMSSSAGAWSSFTPLSDSASEDTVSVALGPDGVVHGVWHDEGLDRAVHVTVAGASINTETVPTVASRGGHVPSIAVSDTGTVWVTSLSGTRRLELAMRDSNAWQVVSLDSGLDRGQLAAVVLDSAANPVIIHQDLEQTDLRVVVVRRMMPLDAQAFSLNPTGTLGGQAVLTRAGDAFNVFHMEGTAMRSVRFRFQNAVDNNCDGQ